VYEAVVPVKVPIDVSVNVSPDTESIKLEAPSAVEIPKVERGCRVGGLRTFLTVTEISVPGLTFPVLVNAFLTITLSRPEVVKSGSTLHEGELEAISHLVTIEAVTIEFTTSAPRLTSSHFGKVRTRFPSAGTSFSTISLTVYAEYAPTEGSETLSTAAVEASGLGWYEIGQPVDLSNRLEPL